MRTSYSLHCDAAGCRWSRLLVSSRDEADQLAQAHAKGGHVVDVAQETSRRVARYEESACSCEVRG